MVLATRVLLMAFLSQGFPLFVECRPKSPKKCFTCHSLVTSSDCGEDFSEDLFLVKECSAEKKYCLKLIETAGRSSFMYRKCTSNTCLMESEIRKGVVSHCTICTKTLCNKASILYSKTMLVSAVLVYVYIHS